MTFIFISLYIYLLFVCFQEVFKEFELTVTLTKSRSGSFGFTITRSKLDNCYYIQDILDNPAKADGRLRAGDRLIMVLIIIVCHNFGKHCSSTDTLHNTVNTVSSKSV